MNIELQLPRGYRIREKQEEMTIPQAVARLTSRAHYRYSTATKANGRAVLTRHSLHCPYCGSEEPAYYSKSRPDRSLLTEWADIQLSLFDSSNTLTLRPSYSPAVFTCPRCEAESAHIDGSYQLRLALEGETLTVSLPVENFAQLMENSWLTRLQLFGGFPMTQQLCFRFDKGEAELRLLGKSGQVLDTLPLTPGSVDENSSLLLTLLRDSIPLRRKVRQLFARFWNCEFPYSTAQLSLDTLLMLTRFTGFPLSFYHAIPLTNGNRPDESFSHILPQLKYYDRCPALLESGKLPRLRSIRRCFGKIPGLLFYLDSCEALWEVLQDPNLLCSILRSPLVYVILSQLHAYPGLIKMYGDYCREKGGPALCRTLFHHLTEFNDQAFTYCVMNESFRQQVRRSWAQRRPFRQLAAELPTLPFSVPMVLPPELIPDCTISGFRFRWLRNAQEYKKAGAALENCLGSWTYNQAPVTVVLKGSEYVAAIEVRGNQIYQMLGYDNCFIEPGTDLHNAILLWAQRNRLHLSHRITEDVP